MEEKVLGVTKLVNLLLGKPVVALLSLLQIHVENPEYPIPNHVAMELLVVALASVLLLWLKSKLSVERPGGPQQVAEMLFTNSMGVGIRDLLWDIVGHGSDKYLSLVGSIGIFVLFCNMISLVPGVPSPTATNSVPLGCAIVVFLYYNYCGVRAQGGLGYAKHFLGPVPAMAVIMLPIEIISNLARLLSLTVRLWVNMVVSELLYVTFLGLTLMLLLYVKGLTVFGWVLAPLPILAGLAFIGLHIFVGFLQAFVFTLLPIIYVSGAVAHEEEQ